MGSKVKKSTKKFLKKSLQHEIVKRKNRQKIYRDSKYREEKKRQRISDYEHRKQEDEKKQEIKSKQNFEDMSVDEFIEKDFLKEDDEEDNQLPSDDDRDEVELSDNDLGGGEVSKKTEKKGKKTSNDDLLDEIEKHKHELAKLKEEDPEFAEFLKQNDDAELLDFSDDEEIDMEEGDIATDLEGAKDIPLTMNALKLLEKQALEEDSVSALKKLTVAFRSACHLGSDEDHHTKYNISDPAVFNEVITFCIGNMFALFEQRLFANKEPVTNNGMIKPTSSKAWKSLQSLVRSFLGNFTNLFTQLAEPAMMTFVVKHIKFYIPYLVPFKRLYHRVFKLLLNIWQKEEDSIKLYAFLAIRDLVLAVPFPFIELCMKDMYLVFARECSMYHGNNAPSIALMINCLVELYSLNFVSAYQHVFVYFRQIAISLRTALQEKTKDAMKKLYNWTVLNSLRFFVKLIAENPKQEDLKQLIYPLCHIMTGIIGFIPTSKYAPLRFTICKMLVELASSTDVFINVAPLALQVLSFSEFKSNAKGQFGKAIDFRYIIHVGKKGAASKAFLTTIVDEVIAVLNEFFKIYAYSIAFPEISFPAILELKKFAKDCKIPMISKKVGQLVEQLKANSEFISSKRRSIDFAPRHITECKSFLTEKHDPAPFVVYYEQWKKNYDQLKSLQKYDFENERDSDDGGRDIKVKDVKKGDEDGDENEEIPKDEEQEQVEEPKKKEKKKPKKKKVQEKPKKKLNGSVPGDDVVGDLVLSDDD